MRVLDLFSGIGGFSLGLERAGMETVAFCELPENQGVIRKQWKDVEIFDDITNFKCKKDVDLVTAGFPCQDISFCGKGAGISGDRSGLFWYIIRTLCMVGRPRALLENVAGLLNRGMGVVLGALASFGYDAEWHCIQPSFVGTPSNRDRVWIYTYAAEKHVEEVVGQRRLSLKPRGMGAEDLSRFGGSVDKCRMGRGTDGVPDRVDRFEFLGNAVHPGIPEIIGRAIMEQQ